MAKTDKIVIPRAIYEKFKSFEKCEDRELYIHQVMAFIFDLEFPWMSSDDKQSEEYKRFVEITRAARLSIFDHCVDQVVTTYCNSFEEDDGNPNDAGVRNGKD